MSDFPIEQTQPAPTPKSRFRQPPFYVWMLIIAGVIYALLMMSVFDGDGPKGIGLQFDPAPILNASPVLQMHVGGAMVCLFVGAWLVMAPKGRKMHKTFGWIWVMAMLLTAISSLFIRDLMNGSFSPIHALTAWTLLTLPLGVIAARRRNILQHRGTMVGLFVGANVIAALFTFLPGRLMWETFFVLQG